MKLKKLSDILPLLEEGLSNKKIASKYGVAVPTVAVWGRRLKDSNIAVPSRIRGRKAYKV